MLNIINLSKYIITNFSNKSREVITPIKLQQLLYYIKVWTLVGKQPLIKDDFIHGQYSPINVKISQKFTDINYQIEEETTPQLNINSNQLQLINFILENYLVFDNFSLRVMTLREKPYQETKLDEVISNESIIAYYQQKRFAKNFQPFDLENNYFYPLDDDCFIIDMKTKDIEEIVRFRNYQEYQNLLLFTKKELTEFTGSLVRV